MKKSILLLIVLFLNYSAVKACDKCSTYMEVSTGAGGSHDSEGTKPMLGVYKVYTVASGNLSLPYSVK